MDGQPMIKSVGKKQDVLSQKGVANLRFWEAGELAKGGGGFM